jgi:hypothetical protein
MEYEEYQCTLSKETQAKAKNELNEDPKTRQKKLEELRVRIAKYPGKKVARKPRLTSGCKHHVRPENLPECKH